MMTYEEVKAKYISYIRELNNYTPKQAGYFVFISKLADLEDEYPEYVNAIDEELISNEIDYA